MIHGVVFGVTFFFFFKQKTAYDVRISDWSSDVCSSDLRIPRRRIPRRRIPRRRIGEAVRRRALADRDSPEAGGEGAGDRFRQRRHPPLSRRTAAGDRKSVV